MIGVQIGVIVVLAGVVWWTRNRSNSYYRLIHHENMESGDQRRYGMKGFLAEAGFLISITFLILVILGTALDLLT